MHRHLSIYQYVLAHGNLQASKNFLQKGLCLYHNLKDMKQIDVEVSATISMNYDPESEEFKDSLESYRDAIEDGASEEDMLRQIAWYITAFGTENMIEGIGYVSVDGEKNGDPEDWCGVDIVNSLNINDTPDFQTTII